MKFTSLEEWKHIEFGANFFLVLFSSLLIFLVHFFRGSRLISGSESYFYVDSGVTGKIISLFSGFDAFLVASLVPYVFGILFVIVFYALLKELGYRFWVRFFSCLVFIVSPGFIYLFSTYNGFFIPVFLLVLSVYLAIKKKFFFWIFAYLVALFGTLHSLIFLFVFLVYSIYNKKYTYLVFMLPSFFVSLFFNDVLVLDGIFISDFGGRFGLGLFIVLMFVFGFFSLWREKYKYISVYLVLIFLFLLSYYDVRVLSYLNVVLCLLSVLGLVYILERKWESRIIGRIVAAVLVFGLIVSSFSYFNFIVNDLPNLDMIDGLGYLEGLPYGVVLADDSRSYWIEYLSGKDAVEVERLFYTRNPENATLLVDENNIDYIWVDDDMLREVWSGEDEGLLFLLEYSEKFKKVYKNEYLTIWKVE